jgi:hypothetical protein
MTLIGYVPLFVAALFYFFVRILGKFGGAYLGAKVTKSDKNIKKYLGLGLIPQAGVAIGLAYMGARIFTEHGHPELGDSLQTIILASSVLYELVGPGLAKLGLYLSKSYKKEEEIKEELVLALPNSESTNLDSLNEQIEISPEEEAYNEAAEEYYDDKDITKHKSENNAG